MSADTVNESASGKYMTGSFDHVALTTENMEESMNFYGNILQLEPDRVDLFLSGEVPFPSYRINASTIIDLFPAEKTQGSDKKLTKNLNHFCLALSKSDFDSVLHRIRQANIAFLTEEPIPRSGAQGIGMSVYLNDPEGTEIELRYYEK
eukprot:CAMPEP_0182443588 /NCGR_PEP_ID=MMETSP1172-20130603/2292_1 /TAXON_ID=708627 /ORGANISM="Timspurckia oligopyrenoides, Strain CCMP3278" /LENGTH=148 /DNA_ID=CAMNT_0024638925 /DNA_START=205 /DNA_END=651 /DNA_ORIENTATION=+